VKSLNPQMLSKCTLNVLEMYVTDVPVRVFQNVPLNVLEMYITNVPVGVYPKCTPKCFRNVHHKCCVKDVVKMYLKML
jgi:hypothetical protein